MLEIRNLSKWYNGPQGIVRALDNISLRVEKEEFVAVQGPSGCGKTTLLLIAGGLLFPNEGQVVLDDQNPYQKSPDDRAVFRSVKIGFVFQQFYLIPYLSVLDNVLAPSLALPQHNARKRAKELIDHFKLTDRIDHLPSELSTGERQRTALARALLNNPGLLLADEPTGNLDRENAEIVLDYFIEFVHSGGAVLMVTHNEGVSEIAHRTLKLKNGRLQ
ncbi:MAG TPA: ABC transporter ATP-binding protein [bacterium]|nr:ABC transporter ATP-binding protein [bacterium]